MVGLGKGNTRSGYIDFKAVAVNLSGAGVGQGARPATPCNLDMSSPRSEGMWSRARTFKKGRNLKELWAKRWTVSGRSPDGAGPSNLLSPVALDFRGASGSSVFLTPRRGVNVPSLLARRCLSDEAPRLKRTPLRLSAVGQGVSPSARPGTASETQAGRECNHDSPLSTRPLPPVQEPRWSVSGAPLSREFVQTSSRFRRLPRADKADLRRAHTLGSSLRRRLFGTLEPRKSLALFNISPGVRGGILSKRMLVEISFPYLAQQCDLCEANLETATICIAHLRKVHGLRRSTFLCFKCGISNIKKHGIECHAAKCTNASRVTRNGMACECCGKMCKSKGGLSLHMRSAHPAAYAAQVRTNIIRQGPPPKRRRWSGQEVDTLQTLMTNLTDTGAILETACARLPARTKEQIRAKVRQLRLKGALAPRVLFGPGDGIIELIEELKMQREVPFEKPISILRSSVLRDLAVKEDRSVSDPILTPLMDEMESTLADLAVVVKVAQDNSGLSLRGQALRNRHFRKGTGSNPPRLNYDRIQEKFNKETGKIARLVLDGSEHRMCPVSIAKVADHFRGKWEAVDRFLGLGQFGSGEVSLNLHLARSISQADVLKARKRIKNGSAAGPDGVTKTLLVKWDLNGAKLARLFNGFLAGGSIPKSLKSNRTTLLPKSKDVAERFSMSNWRPITIGSMILRLFSSVMFHRLASACSTSVRQKGFCKVPGCSENLLIIEGILKVRSTAKVPLAMVFIDLAKAFDSISHKHIQAVLEERLVDPAMVSLIMDSYVGCTTKVRTECGLTPNISMDIGVKQGDPLSPLLFNLAIDPLLRMLESRGQGFLVGTDSFAVLAYADDLVLLSNSWEGMHRNMSILDAFCDLTGLKVNAAKSHGFFIAGGKNVVNRLNNCPTWKLGGAEIDMVGLEGTVKYLGMEISPARGILKPDVLQEIVDMGVKIEGAPLKPTQKVELLRDYGIPRSIYKAVHSSVKQVNLLRADLEIRRLVKKWLHLSPGTANGLLYSNHSDGGLAIPCLSKSNPRSEARRIFRLYHSEDKMVARLVRRTRSPREFIRSWKAGGGDKNLSPEMLRDLLNPEQIKYSKPDCWRRTEFVRWTKLGPQGFGISLFKGDKVSNSWLVKRGRFWWNEAHFIRALQMRANVLPTQEFRHRGAGLTFAPPCRACGKFPETSSHILGQCEKTKLNRMARHNRICNLLAVVARRKSWKVIQEKRVVNVNGSWGVPDLIMTRDSTLMVVDVTIRFEGSVDWLVKARTEKERKYAPHLGALSLEFQSTTSSSHGFVVGVRGKWLRSNFDILKRIGLSKTGARNFAKICSRTTVLKSVDVFQAFNKAVHGKVLPLDL